MVALPRRMDEESGMSAACCVGILPSGVVVARLGLIAWFDSERPIGNLGEIRVREAPDLQGDVNKHTMPSYDEERPSEQCLLDSWATRREDGCGLNTLSTSYFFYFFMYIQILYSIHLVFGQFFWVFIWIPLNWSGPTPAREINGYLIICPALEHLHREHLNCVRQPSIGGPFGWCWTLVRRFPPPTLASPKQIPKDKFLNIAIDFIRLK